jgi:hypothetical protein
MRDSDTVLTVGQSLQLLQITNAIMRGTILCTVKVLGIKIECSTKWMKVYQSWLEGMGIQNKREDCKTLHDKIIVVDDQTVLVSRICVL